MTEFDESSEDENINLNNNNQSLEQNDEDDVNDYGGENDDEDENSDQLNSNANDSDGNDDNDNEALSFLHNINLRAPRKSNLNVKDIEKLDFLNILGCIQRQTLLTSNLTITRESTSRKRKTCEDIYNNGSNSNSQSSSSSSSSAILSHYDSDLSSNVSLIATPFADLDVYSFWLKTFALQPHVIDVMTPSGCFNTVYGHQFNKAMTTATTTTSSSSSMNGKQEKSSRMKYSRIPLYHQQVDDNILKSPWPNLRQVLSSPSSSSSSMSIASSLSRLVQITDANTPVCNYFHPSNFPGLYTSNNVSDSTDCILDDDDDDHDDHKKEEKEENSHDNNTWSHNDDTSKDNNKNDKNNTLENPPSPLPHHHHHHHSSSSSRRDMIRSARPCLENGNLAWLECQPMMEATIVKEVIKNDIHPLKVLSLSQSAVESSLSSSSSSSLQNDDDNNQPQQQPSLCKDSNNQGNNNNNHSNNHNSKNNKNNNTISSNIFRPVPDALMHLVSTSIEKAINSSPRSGCVDKALYTNITQITSKQPQEQPLSSSSSSCLSSNGNIHSNGDQGRDTSSNSSSSNNNIPTTATTTASTHKNIFEAAVAGIKSINMSHHTSNNSNNDNITNNNNSNNNNNANNADDNNTHYNNNYNSNSSNNYSNSSIYNSSTRSGPELTDSYTIQEKKRELVRAMGRHAEGVADALLDKMFAYFAPLSATLRQDPPSAVLVDELDGRTSTLAGSYHTSATTKRSTIKRNQDAGEEEEEGEGSSVDLMSTTNNNNNNNHHHHHHQSNHIPLVTNPLPRQRAPNQFMGRRSRKRSEMRDYIVARREALEQQSLSQLPTLSAGEKNCVSSNFSSLSQSHSQSEVPQGLGSVYIEKEYKKLQQSLSADANISSSSLSSANQFNWEHVVFAAQHMAATAAGTTTTDPNLDVQLSPPADSSMLPSLHITHDILRRTQYRLMNLFDNASLRSLDRETAFQHLQSHRQQRRLQQLVNEEALASVAAGIVKAKSNKVEMVIQKKRKVE